MQLEKKGGRLKARWQAQKERDAKKDGRFKKGVADQKEMRRRWERGGQPKKEG